MPRLALLALLPGCLFAQPKTLGPQGPVRMEINVERWAGGKWTPVDPGFVFESGDRLRFRFRANFAGHLYVMNYGTSGSYTLLFPREETGRANRVESGQQYTVPATNTLFRVSGPPGYDIVYWLLSPLPLGAGDPSLSPAGPPKPSPPKTLIPRCDDALFRARGACIDSNAGPRTITPATELPANLKGVERMQSRELVIIRKPESFTVSAPAALQGPVLYEFRLAHK